MAPMTDAAERVPPGQTLWRSRDGLIRLVGGLHGPVLEERHRVLTSLEPGEAAQLAEALTTYRPRTVGPRETKG